MSVALRRGLPATASVTAPADRRFRRPDVRPGRRRRVAQLIRRVGLIVLVVVGASAATVWSAHAVLSAKSLQVRTLTMRGNAWLSNGEVEALLDGVRGENILLVDLDRYRRRLMDSPWVAGATFRRVLPATLEVRIVERVPMAIARLNQQLYLVDGTGMLMDEFGPQYREFDLPVVDGLVITPKHGSPTVDPTRALLLGRVFDDLHARPDLRRRVSQIDVSDARDVVVLLDGDSALVHLGDGRFVERLKTYVELGPTLQERLPDIDYVDMRYDERVYVRSGTPSRGQRVDGQKVKGRKPK